MHPFPYFNQQILLSPSEQQIVDDFHNLYFQKLEQRSGLQLSWLGHLVGKLPSDLWRYQEIIFEYKPDLIIETGTHWGGSAMYLATILDLVDHGQLISVDKYPKDPLPSHHRVSYLSGDSTSDDIIAQLAEKCLGLERIMIVLDSDHHMEHVTLELSSYSKLLPPGGHLIVEDTFLGGNPSHHHYGAGPSPSIEKFLENHKDFYVEKKSERFLFTLNRGGYLRRHA